MKVKLDENLPALLTVALGELGHDVHTSNEEGLGGYPDDQIWRAAQREGRFLITQDLDFSDVRQFVQALTTAFCLSACTHRVNGA